MPRQARLDIPGLLQHVIVRGIERRNIFRDNGDRKDFVKRLSFLLQETNTDCFAWALIPNHFHLLLRPNQVELKQFMRRLLTGYAVTFNRRHRRAGHVFQNRYKSIVCEQEAYLLELIRYIHLNPLRAGLAKDLATLARYQLCGHSVLMGSREMPGQEVGEVLALFGKNATSARRHYLHFVAAGIAQGQRPELVGGGRQRSQARALNKDGEPEPFDERVLGGGAFVERLRGEEALRDKLVAGIALPELMLRVERYFGLAAGAIRERRHKAELVAARDIFCHVAVRVLRQNGVEVGAMLGIKRSAVSHAVRRGQEAIGVNQRLVEEILW